MRSCIHALVWLMSAGVLVQSAAAGACDADLNHDGAVNTLDLGTLLASWTLPPARACAGSSCLADLSGDGLVNTLDLGQLLVAWGTDCSEPPAPRVVITPVAHSGDPAPGIPFPGAFLDVLLTPQIDAGGNVFFKAFIGAPGLGELGNQALFYGQPGDIHKLIWETDPAPHFPAGVIIKSLFGTNERLCEAGIVSFGATLLGPGITAGVNDMAIFVGDPRVPGDIRPILQTGDQAPGLDPGVTVNYDFSGVFFGAEQSDNGTLMVFSRLQGPGVTVDNDYAFWTGTRSNLQLVWRNGMHAPGTPTGVTFSWADNVSINDSGQIAIRGNVTGPGIVDGSDTGRWMGGPGSLQVAAWTGLPAPQLPKGTIFAVIQGGLTSLNSHGDMYAVALIQGPGVTPENDQALFVGPPDSMSFALRQGDPAPQTEPGTVVVTIGNVFINDRRESFFRLSLAGSLIDTSNMWAMYYGPLDRPEIALRDGDPAPQFQPDVRLARVVAAMSLAALNDVGDIVTVTEVTGPGVTPLDKTVLWRRDARQCQWYPLLRSNDAIDGRMVDFQVTTFAGAYWQKTGGSDGFGLSFNDVGQLSLKLEFTDSTHGIYIIQTEPLAQPPR